MAGIDYVTEVQRACICYISEDGKLGQPTYEGCILWGHVILMTHLYRRTILHIDLDNPGEADAFYNGILQDSQWSRGYNTLVIFDDYKSSRFEPRDMDKEDVQIFDKHLSESHYLYGKSVAKFIKTGCELVGRYDSFKALKDFRMDGVIFVDGTTRQLKKGDVVQLMLHIGENSYYDYDIEIRGDGKADRVTCRLSSMPTELQRLIVAGYLEVMDEKE